MKNKDIRQPLTFAVGLVLFVTAFASVGYYWHSHFFISAAYLAFTVILADWAVLQITDRTHQVTVKGPTTAEPPKTAELPVAESKPIADFYPTATPEPDETIGSKRPDQFYPLLYPELDFPSPSAPPDRPRESTPRDAGDPSKPPDGTIRAGRKII